MRATPGDAVIGRVALFLCAMLCVLVPQRPAHAATPAIGAGAGHSIALRADGTVRSWGNDASGQLGVGRSLVSANPATVAGVSGIVAIAAGYSYVVALKGDGTVLAWGENSSGQLGDGTRTNRSTPVAVSGLAGVTAIWARGAHTFAQKRDGSLWAWGSNAAGEIGDGTYEDRLSPVPLPGMSDVVALAPGHGHTLALKRDGTVWAWGANDSGQLGDGTRTAPYTGRATPALVPGLSGVVAISAGLDHSLARKADGTVWSWGSNLRGQLGDGTTADRLLAVPVGGLTGVTFITAGYGHSVAIKGDGSAWAWGSNGYSELGDGTYVDRLTPVPLSGLAGAAAISAGFLHCLARIADGTLVAWGNNDFGQLGDGTTQARYTPAGVNGISGIAAVAVGDQHSVALMADGTVRTWGDNGSGQLGNGSLILASTPAAVALANVVAISAGGFHGLALKADGSVLAWGDNRGRQLGDGTLSNRSTPATVNTLGPGSGVVAISAGGLHNLALKSDGTVLAWGYNYSGELGDRADADPSTPGQVIGLAGVIALSAGGEHSVALKNDGTVWTWGRNNSGQLGDGTRTIGYDGRSTPMRVNGLSSIIAISAGGSHTAALMSGGTVWTWGSNGSGELGDGTTTDRLAPVRVEGLTDVVAIAAGEAHTLALRRDGSVWSWGANYSFQVGDGTSQDRLVPVPVTGLGDVVAIATSSHALALTKDGSVRAWGANAFGSVGDGTLADRASPVVVLRENGAGSVAGNDWFLDLDPGIATTIPAESVPVFLVVASPAAANINANIRYRSQDVGSAGSVYVFALAPSGVVKGAPKDAPPPCVLAQLNSSGQLQAVSASSLQAYASGVLSSQGQAVTVLNAANAAQLGGATFYVGYGASSTAMLSAGTNRSVVSVPGTVSCQPQAPQTGWWWNPLEDGRGYSIEVRGNHYFFASFLYDISGRATWYVSTGSGVSLDGSLISGDLLSASGGQTLGGAYPGSPRVSTVGPMTLAFSDASHGTLLWPGGTVPIERFNIVPNGLNLAQRPNQPENGWWWNPEESGRGFFLEWQGDRLDIAGYMYDDAGNPIWYITVNLTPNADLRQFSSNWWQYANGMTLMGPWRQNQQVSDHVAPVAITFQGTENAIITLPNGRTTALTRHRF